MTPSQRPKRPFQVLLWVARITSIAVGLGVLIATVSEIVLEGAQGMTGRDVLLIALFPFGTCLGFAIAWWRELVGGVAALVCLAVFLLIIGEAELLAAGVVFSMPGFLFLIYAVASGSAAARARGAESRKSKGDATPESTSVLDHGHSAHAERTTLAESAVPDGDPRRSPRERTATGRLARWKGDAALSGYMIWTVVGLGLALATHPFSPDRMVNSGWVSFSALIMVTVCMSTERGLWPVWKRILAVPAAYLVQQLLSYPAMIFGWIAYSAGAGTDIADYVMFYFASAPLVLWAMWHSRLFVTELPTELNRSEVGGTAS